MVNCQHLGSEANQNDGKFPECRLFVTKLPHSKSSVRSMNWNAAADTTERFTGSPLPTLVPPVEDMDAIHALVRPILEAVAEVVRTQHAPVVWNECDFPANMLLSVLTFCYSNGVFESEEIADISSEHTVLRYLCARKPLDAAVLRRFRKRHHHELKDCLEHYFGNATISHGAGQGVRNPHEFAEACLRRALLVDSAALDF